MQTLTADIVIIGSGVGGTAVAHQLAGSGAKILILERGDFLPDEPQNSDAEAVFGQQRYKTRDAWLTPEGAAFRPGRSAMPIWHRITPKRNGCMACAGRPVLTRQSRRVSRFPMPQSRMSR